MHRSEEIWMLMSNKQPVETFYWCNALLRMPAIIHPLCECKCCCYKLKGLFRGDQRCCCIFLRAQREEGELKGELLLSPLRCFNASLHSVYKKASNTSRGTQGNSGNIFRWRRACLCRTPPNQSRGAFAAAGRKVKPIVCLQKWAKIKVRSDRTSDPRLMTQNSNRWHKAMSKNVILPLLPLAESTITNLLSQRGGDSKLRVPRRARNSSFHVLSSHSIFPLFHHSILSCLFQPCQKLADIKLPNRKSRLP